MLNLEIRSVPILFEQELPMITGVSTQASLPSAQTERPQRA